VNEKVNCVKATVAWGMAVANTNTELVPDVNMCDACLADISSNFSGADYSMDFVHLTEGPRGHMDCIQSVHK
jgi:hypothetical protein